MPPSENLLILGLSHALVVPPKLGRSYGVQAREFAFTEERLRDFAEDFQRLILASKAKR